MANTTVAVLGDLSRFENPSGLKGYPGFVASENSSGEKTRRGSITKTGHGHDMYWSRPLGPIISRPESAGRC